MRRRHFLTAAPALWIDAAWADLPSARPLAAGEWPALLGSLAGRRGIVHLWGVSCSICVAELPRWGAFMRAHIGERIVLLQAEAATLAQVGQAMQHAGLRSGQSWSVQGYPDERWQYAIDPRWGGELPHTLMLEADGRMSTFSGPADFRLLHDWLRSPA